MSTEFVEFIRDPDNQPRMVARLEHCRIDWNR